MPDALRVTRTERSPVWTPDRSTLRMKTGRICRLFVVFSRNFGGGSGPSVPGKEVGSVTGFGASDAGVKSLCGHDVRLLDPSTLVSGGPAYDLLANPLGESARAPRHRIDARFRHSQLGWGPARGDVWTSGGQDGVGGAEICVSMIALRLIFACSGFLTGPLRDWPNGLMPKACAFFLRSTISLQQLAARH
jgi:hypothetical protein